MLKPSRSQKKRSSGTKRRASFEEAAGRSTLVLKNIGPPTSIRITFVGVPTLFSPSVGVRRSQLEAAALGGNEIPCQSGMCSKSLLFCQLWRSMVGRWGGTGGGRRRRKVVVIVAYTCVMVVSAKKKGTKRPCREINSPCYCLIIAPPRPSLYPYYYVWMQERRTAVVINPILPDIGIIEYCV